MPAAPVKMVARYTPTPIKIDGVLDEAAWKDAAVYKMYLADDRAADGTQLQEGGEVMAAWDDNYFYLAAKFHDSDVVAGMEKDQELLFNYGDICELYLKPETSSWYWELYCTPKGNKATLWIPGRGRFGLDSLALGAKSGLVVAATVDGTVNDWKDKDKCWYVEMAMPVKDLRAYGDAFGRGTAWRILVGRYNYSKDLATIGPELSMTPKLPKTFFHLTDYYAVVEFQ